MKNAVEYIKTNKARIIKTSLVVVGTAAAIALVGYVASRNVDIEVTELEA